MVTLTSDRFVDLIITNVTKDALLLETPEMQAVVDSIDDDIKMRLMNYALQYPNMRYFMNGFIFALFCIRDAEAQVDQFELEKLMKLELLPNAKFSR